LLTAPTLDELRAKMPAGRFRLVRGTQDAPDVVEVWL
jgi:hypothetical protein